MGKLFRRCLFEEAKRRYEQQHGPPAVARVEEAPKSTNEPGQSRSASHSTNVESTSTNVAGSSTNVSSSSRNVVQSRSGSNFTAVSGSATSSGPTSSNQAINVSSRASPSTVFSRAHPLSSRFSSSSSNSSEGNSIEANIATNQETGNVTYISTINDFQAYYLNHVTHSNGAGTLENTGNDAAFGSSIYVSEPQASNTGESQTSIYDSTNLDVGGGDATATTTSTLHGSAVVTTNTGGTTSEGAAALSATGAAVYTGIMQEDGTVVYAYVDPTLATAGDPTSPIQIPAASTVSGVGPRLEPGTGIRAVQHPDGTIMYSRNPHGEVVREQPPPPPPKQKRRRERIYACAECGIHLCLGCDLVSKKFRGRTGGAWLFEKVYNVFTSDVEETTMTTGSHAVRQVYCIECESLLGWTYERAFNKSQEYKEGKTILEEKLIKVV